LTYSFLDFGSCTYATLEKEGREFHAPEQRSDLLHIVSFEMLQIFVRVDRLS
jgi:hypothetical protein